MRAVFLDAGSVDAGDLDWSALRQVCPDLAVHDHTRPAQLAERIATAQLIVVNKVVLGAEQIAAAADLKMIALAATGSNNIDLPAARARGIVVSNLRGYATASVAQHVFAVMLALKTRWADYHQAVRAGHWSRAPHFCLLNYPITELAGRQLGIVGYGELGQAVARLARAFDMHVLVAERRDAERVRAGRLPFTEVLAQADVLSLHCPLDETTHHLINADTLAAMRPEAVLINTARGAIVEPESLVAALRSGQLAGAAIDVVEPEPPPADHPLLAAAIPNLIVTPHTAWASREARQRALDQLAANVRAFQAGTPENVVT